MFRKSDYLAPQLHPTYAKKPPSEFQMMGQLAQFDDGGRRRAAEEDQNSLYGRPAAAPVPATYDTVYAPEDPNADWGGLVDRSQLSKKHVSGHVCQRSNLIQSEHGIVGAESRKEFSTVSRIDWGHGDHSEEPLIGGTALPDQYKTVARQLQNGEGTTREQLSLMKRTMKPIPDQPREEKKPQRATQFKENFPQGGGVSQWKPNGTKSCISDLGEALVHLTPDPPQVKRKTKN